MALPAGERAPEQYKTPMPASRDERLAFLIDDLAHRRADLEAAAQRHPELAEELRELWAVAQFAELAKPRLSQTTILSAARPEQAPSTNALPRSFGDFYLLSELGRGGMGVVYKAKQQSLNRIVALKMVREAHLASESDRARFRTEAESAARLQHSNIVGVHEVGTSEGQAYLSMEYVEGRTLTQRIVAEGPLPPRDAANFTAILARALQHAHEQGVLHRDLKPSNILLDVASGEPKIADFGLAKLIDRVQSLTLSGAIVGTPSYMAPEQATNRREVNATADVYSLGAILYEMLTGRPPFQSSNPVDTLLMVLEQEPVRPRDLNASVDRDLELICLKCLQKPAELRYPTAARLAEDLEAYLVGDRLTVQPGSLGSFVSRLLRETHHAAVLENWGLLWMWHSVVIFVICVATQIMELMGLRSHGYYLALWGPGLVIWGAIFWRLRRRGGPVLFVERQIAHAWVAGATASIGLFLIEVVQKLPALTLSPVLAVVAGMVFFFKAGTLSGQFYLWVLAYFGTAVAMAALPGIGHLLFGVVSALSFFLPGLKYYRQRKRAEQVA